MSSRRKLNRARLRLVEKAGDGVSEADRVRDALLVVLQRLNPSPSAAVEALARLHAEVDREWRELHE